MDEQDTGNTTRVVPPPIPPPMRQAPGDGTGGLIPWRNPPALAAYYLGVFSFIPILGMFLGLAALVLGLTGLRVANRRPEARGKVHAWIGIIVGGLFGIGYLALAVVILVGFFAARADF